jgi:D-alanyl-D-alanine carboxypeptidase (penicillin-binding protein 5/6)
VHDLAVIGRAALADPVVSGYLRIPRARLSGRGGAMFEIQNHNALLGSYPGTIGVKNGYTVAAGATYIGAARRNGRTLIVALLRTEAGYRHDASKLLDWGFANAGRARPVGRLAEKEQPTSHGGHLAGQSPNGRDDRGNPKRTARPSSTSSTARSAG